MRKKTIRYFSLFLSLMLLLSGCGLNKNNIVEENVVNQEIENNIQIENTNNDLIETNHLTYTTVANIKDKYGVLNEVSIKPFYNVEQKTQFVFHFNSDVKPYQAVTVHTDPKCELNSTVYQINDGYVVDDGVDVVVKPGSPILNTSDRVDGEVEYDSWGNAPIYYLSINYDMESKEVVKLDKPIIVPFTVKSKVSIPNLTGSITEDGLFELCWNKVDGAVKYNIYRATEVRSSEGADKYTRSECAYIGDYLTKLTTVDANTLTFSDFDLKETNGVLKDNSGYVYNQNNQLLETYYVTAVDKDGNESFFSMAVESWKYKNQLPYNFDLNAEIKKDGSYYCELPETVSVKMKDLTYFDFPINYYKIGDWYDGVEYRYEIVGTALTGKFAYKNNTGVYEDEILSTVTPNTGLYQIKNSVNIIPENTLNTIIDEEYKNTILNLDKIADYDQSKKITYSREAILGRVDIEMARAICDGVYPDGLTPESMFDYTDVQIIYPTETDVKIEENEPDVVEPEVIIPEIIEPEEITIPEEITSENLVEEQIESTKKEVEEANKITIPIVEYPIYADNAEEEYIALSLINGIENIDLSPFPSLLNADYLLDVFYKVHFQNPYHLGFDNIYLNYETKTLKVEYSTDISQYPQKQKEIYEESNRIIKEIIKDGMTDEEKVMAIWTYLEKNTQYDTKALEVATASNFTDVSGFNDSFNAYGILCKKIGVCQSYAYTFKLLADLAGLDSIVITGYMGKDMPHGWNVVKLGDEWYFIDTTNNLTNSGVPYLMYQTSVDLLVQAGYVLDTRYEIDNQLENYITFDSTKDWYYTKGLMPTTVDELSSLISMAFKENNMVIVKPHFANINVNTFDTDLATSLYNKGVSGDVINRTYLEEFNGLWVIYYK